MKGLGRNEDKRLTNLVKGLLTSSLTNLHYNRRRILLLEKLLGASSRLLDCTIGVFHVCRSTKCEIFAIMEKMEKKWKGRIKDGFLKIWMYDCNIIFVDEHFVE